ncbi:MAG: N-acetylmuramoyl-L-alanine amidase [Victivallales bacterium]|nr:N-acetylmuramoyl-L-alanine amidase [Victivallales bacterium]
MPNTFRHRLLLLTAILLWLVTAPAGRLWQLSAAEPQRSVIHYITVNSRKYLRLSEIARFYKCTVSQRITSKEKVLTITNRLGQKVVFTADSVKCTLDGYQVNFCYKVIFRNGDFHLEQTDFTNFLDPILRTQTIPKRKIKTIMLDPGHGGKDQGTEQSGTKEKDLNLLLAKRVRSILQKRGYTVLMTREKDADLTLAARSALCTSKKPDLFISLHCNAHSEASVNGIEVWIANPAGVPSYGTTTLGKNLPGTKFHSSNALLAYLTLKNLVKATKAVDRGVRRKQLYVISHSPAPSMLVEFGFLSNEAERKKILSAEYQDKLSAALCDAIDQFAKVTAPKPKPTPGAPPRHHR